MKGIEILVNSIIKSIGIDPDEMMKKFSEAYEFMTSSIKHFDSRLTAIEKQLEKLAAQNETHEIPLIGDKHDGNDARE